jgi:hypothetical protein
MNITSILKDCRMIKLTSKEFRTLIEHGWSAEDLGVAEVTYDPDLALYLLENRHPNRTISPTDQDKIGTALSSGRWRLNGQSIVLSQAMRLMNGQNRLHACWTKEMSLTSVTVWGIPFGNAQTMDIGKKHSGANILEQLEVSDASSVAAALRTFFKIEQRALPSTTVVLPDYEIVDYHERQKSIHYSVTYGNMVRRFVPPSLGTALHYAFRLTVKHEADDAAKALPDVMFQQLAEGQNLSARDPIYVLRELLSLRRTKDTRRKQQLETKEYAHLGAQMIQGWNALRQHRAITRAGLIWDEKKDFPEIL